MIIGLDMDTADNVAALPANNPSYTMLLYFINLYSPNIP